MLPRPSQPFLQLDDPGRTETDVPRCFRSCMRARGRAQIEVMIQIPTQFKEHSLIKSFRRIPTSFQEHFLIKGPSKIWFRAEDRESMPRRPWPAAAESSAGLPWTEPWTWASHAPWTHKVLLAFVSELPEQRSPCMPNQEFQQFWESGQVREAGCKPQHAWPP